MSNIQHGISNVQVGSRHFECHWGERIKKTGEQGLEPRLMDPETIVLPLHHSPVQVEQITQYEGICQGDL